MTITFVGTRFSHDRVTDNGRQRDCGISGESKEIRLILNMILFASALALRRHFHVLFISTHFKLAVSDLDLILYAPHLHNVLSQDLRFHNLRPHCRFPNPYSPPRAALSFTVRLPLSNPVHGIAFDTFGTLTVGAGIFLFASTIHERRFGPHRMIDASDPYFHGRRPMLSKHGRTRVPSRSLRSDLNQI